MGDDLNRKLNLGICKLNNLYIDPIFIYTCMKLLLKSMQWDHDYHLCDRCLFQ